MRRRRSGRYDFCCARIQTGLRSRNLRPTGRGRVGKQRVPVCCTCKRQRRVLFLLVDPDKTGRIRHFVHCRPVTLTTAPRQAQPLLCEETTVRSGMLDCESVTARLAAAATSGPREQRAFRILDPSYHRQLLLRRAALRRNLGGIGQGLDGQNFVYRNHRRFQLKFKQMRKNSCFNR